MSSQFARSVWRSAVDSIRLEIGFGGGEHLLHRMRENPGTGFIGVEPFVNGMAKLLAGLHAEPMRNVRLFDQDAALLLDWLPAASLSHVDILYPDPWPKKRQHKRRFISPENLVRLARCHQARRNPVFRFRHRRLCQLDADPCPRPWRLCV